MDRKVQRKGINRFLRDLYGHTRLLSTILYAGGFSKSEVRQLHDKRLHLFLAGVARRWCAWLRTVLLEDEANVLIHGYALQGRPVPSLQELGDDLGMADGEVLQLQQSALDELRQWPHRSDLERLVCEAAHYALPADERGTWPY